MNKCIDCGKKTKKYNAKRCWQCYCKWAKNPKNNPSYKHGKSTYQHYCKKCKTKISWKVTYCKSCVQLGKKHTLKTRKKMSEQRRKNKHWNWKGGLPKCMDCRKELSNYYSKRCKSCSHKKELNFNWKDGISKLPYNFSFDSKLKAKIRNRDNFKCRLCNMLEEEHLTIFGTFLTIHHIDYDKQNCNDNNLISLCFYCNSRANFNRKYWTKYFKEKIKCLKMRN